MVANPTSNWDTVPVTARYLNIVDDSPKSGSVIFTLTQRITRSDGTVIYPGGGKIEVPLNGAGVLSTSFPASDDPDITPNDWSVKVEERLTDGSGLTYYITPTLAGGEIKLGNIISPITSAPPGAMVKGVPGGVAALNTVGQVVDASGIPVGGGVTSYLNLSDVPGTFPASPHTHPESDIIGLTGDLANKLDNTGSVETLVDGATKKLMTASERMKLAGVATGATVNDTDANLKNRANHTGTQPVNTITGLAAVATSGAKGDIGLANVDNTADVNKPVSTAQNAAIIAALVNSYAVIDYNTGTSSYPLRNTVTTDVNRPARWRGPVAPTIGNGYAITGKDEWAQTT